MRHGKRSTGLRIASGAALLILFSGTAPAMALDGEAIVAEACVACHDMTGPAPRSYSEVVARKAPDLFYAGSKFNRAWLVAWIQEPTVIRPAGVLFLNHVVNEEGRDTVRPETIEPCATNLNPEAAEAVADHLMTLRDPTMKTGLVEAGRKLKKQKAYRLFSKQMPCIGCHRARIGKRARGGISGPDLTRAGTRLNPDWVYAWIDNPQYWNPMAWMPRIEMSHKKREMLTLFVTSMK